MDPINGGGLRLKNCENNFRTYEEEPIAFYNVSNALLLEYFPNYLHLLSNEEREEATRVTDVLPNKLQDKIFEYLEGTRRTGRIGGRRSRRSSRRRSKRKSRKSRRSG